MAARIVINPVVVVGDTRTPKCATIADPGRAPVNGIDDEGQPFTTFKTYVASSAISDGLPGQRNGHCVSLVVGVDMSALDADPEIQILFEQVDPMLAAIHAHLLQTPAQLGWDAAKQQRVRDRLVNHGVAVAGITANTPLYAIVNRVCQEFNPGFDIREAWALVPGA